MAKIEMEMSEYNEIISHKETLKKTLCDLEKAKDEIIKLEREKAQAEKNKREELIEIHKNNENIVSIIEEVRTSSHVYVPKSTTEILWRLRNLGFDVNKLDIHASPSHIDVNNLFKQLFGCMYDTTETRSSEIRKSYSKRLNEIKSELKDVALTELDDDVKSKLGQYKKIQERVGELTDKNRDLKITIDKLSEESKLFEDIVRKSEDDIKGVLSFLIKIIENVGDMSRYSMIKSNKHKIGNIRQILNSSMEAIDEIIKKYKINA